MLNCIIHTKTNQDMEENKKLSDIDLERLVEDMDPAKMNPKEISSMDDPAARSLAGKLLVAGEVSDSSNADFADAETAWQAFATKKRMIPFSQRKKFILHVAAVLLVLLVSSVWVYRQNCSSVLFAAASSERVVYLVYDGQSVQMDTSFIDLCLDGYDKYGHYRIETTPGMQVEVLLPDSSRVCLNAQSSMTYHHKLAASRQVTLSGEGYFEVKRDTVHPFCIEADGVNAKVLGTSFNLRHYGREQFQLTLLTGRVALESAQKDFSQVMKPGEEAELQSDGKLYVKAVHTSQSTLWREGYFAYDDILMSEILCDLGRWYNINIKVLNDRAMSRRLHFKCKRSLPVEDVLEILNELGHFRLIRKGDTIFLE